MESIRLYLPETAYAPEVATLSVGLYAPVEGYRLGITAADGSGLGDALPLADVTIQSLPGTYPNPQNQNFNDEIRLVGYDYDRRTLAAGEPLTVRLYWEALQEVPPDYLAEVGLRRPPGEPWDQVWSMTTPLVPQISNWQVGFVIMTEHVLETAVAPADYVVHVALLDPSTRQTQNIIAADGHWIDDHLLLARIRIEP